MDEEDGRHALPGVGREGGRVEAADRLCNHRGVDGHFARRLTWGSCLSMYQDVMGHVRYGGVVLGIDISTDDQGSEVVRLDKPGLA